MKKKKNEGPKIRSCEKVTVARSIELMEYGERAAILAKAKGKTQQDWKGFCPLIGDNNRDSWLIGWDSEWTK